MRGTTAQAFEAFINFVYHRGCKFKTHRELFDAANLAEMYDVEGFMMEIEKTLQHIQIKLTNVVVLANTAEKLSIFSSFTISEDLLTKCCFYLQNELRTRVIDFSGLKHCSRYVETVKVLHDRILELPLSACQLCPQFVIDDKHHDCPYDTSDDEVEEEEDPYENEEDEDEKDEDEEDEDEEDEDDEDEEDEDEANEEN